MAFKHIVPKNNYSIKANGYKTNEIKELLQLKGNDEQHTEFVIANHINKFITFYCNSDKTKVRELNYIDTLFDSKAKIFVSSFYEYIINQTRQLLNKMNNGEIEITHDFYLKKFQLSNPKLNFDYILFDEGQDASSAMLDIFLKQDATKVIVGDSHQQIYSWRYAINSLEKVDFKIYNLSTSFRFNNAIAKLAMGVLKYKEHIADFDETLIIGKGKSQVSKSSVILARTNLGLLVKAIEFIQKNKKIKKIYFEGNINSYTYADEGTSLYDVLDLYNNNKGKIKDSLIGKMKDIKELEDYIDKTEDFQMQMMVDIVKEYGNELPKLIRSLKSKHIESDEKEKAEMIFSTVHKCKGMEYDTVHLVNDFITEERLEKLKEEELNISKLNEEINLLYVAITRTKNQLFIPETFLPKNFAKYPNIHSLLVLSEKEKKQHLIDINIKPKDKKNKPKSNYLEEKRAKHKGAYKPWTHELDFELTEMYNSKANIIEIAEHFERSIGAIQSRLIKLELVEQF